MRIIQKLFLMVFVLSICSIVFAGEEEEKTKVQTKDETTLEEIVVTATRTEKEVESAPGSVSVVTKKDMEKRNIKTIDEAVNTVPGVFNPRHIKGGLMDPLPNGGINLRGFGRANKTLTLFDGITLNDSYSGSQRSMLAFDPEDIERIEIVKGPFSSLYGGYAMGGVLNIIPRMPEKREFTLKTGYGTSWERGDAPDDVKSLYLSYGDKLWDKLRLFFSYKIQDTNGYARDEQFSRTAPLANITGATRMESNTGTTRYLIGDRGDMTWRDDKITARIGYSFSEDSKINFSVTNWGYKYDFDEPHTYLRDTTTGTLVYWPKEASFVTPSGGKSELQEQIYTLSYERQLGIVKSKLSLGFIDRGTNWYISADTSYATLSGLSSNSAKSAGRVSSSLGESYNADLQFTLPLGQKQILTFGGSFLGGSADSKRHLLSNWKDEDSKISLQFQGKGKYRMLSSYIQDEIAVLNNLTVYPSFRYDWWEGYDGYVNYAGASDYPKNYDSTDASSYSPKLAVVYKPFEKTTLRSSAGTAFRPPSVYELYSASITSASLTEGNPNLKPEKSFSWEAGIQQILWKGAKIDLTYFKNYISDLLTSVSYGKDSLGRDLKTQENIGKAESNGVEIGITQQFGQWLNLFSNYTYTKTEITENKANPALVGNKTMMAPEHMFNIGGDLTYGAFLTSLTGRYVGKRYSTETNTDTINHVYGSYDPYFVADAKVSCKLTKFSTLSFSVDNLFDRDYYIYYKAPGRSWFCELTMRF